MVTGLVWISSQVLRRSVLVEQERLSTIATLVSFPNQQHNITQFPSVTR